MNASRHLSDEDKETFMEWGYVERDIVQIEEALKKTSLSQKDGRHEKRISRNEAISTMKREDFLSGISRSAFHFSTMRESTVKVSCICFDLRRYFQE